MSAVSQIYEELRTSEMNDWVGGSDPQLVGDFCFAVMRRYMTFNSTSRVLDFGCGVGRVMLAVLNNHPDVARIVGFDIMPQVVQFCDSHIATSFPNTSFELIQGSNDHYDEFIAKVSTNSAKSHALLHSEYRSAFTGIYAFSVFTHVELADFRSLLSLLADLLEPGGQLLFTCFLLTPATRISIEKRAALFPFGAPQFEASGNVFVGNLPDRLGFIAFDHSLVEGLVLEAGLVMTHVEYGSWAGSVKSFNLQDVIVCTRPIESTAPSQYVPMVTRNSSRTTDIAAPDVPHAVARAASVPALLALNGEEFVRACYATILDRLPDPEGLQHYLTRLQTEKSKMEVILSMRKSAEGQRNRRPLPGYRRALIASRLRLKN